MITLETRPKQRKETELVDPRDIAVATTTFYKDWKPLEGMTRDMTDIEGIRGDLALRTLSLAKSNGFQIAVVDGGSSVAFRNALSEKIGKTPSDEDPKGISASRRQVFGEAAALDGVKVIAWMEPEKATMITSNNLQKAALPILRDTADVVIPKRDAFAFFTYPGDQIVLEEQNANRKFNALLRDNHLLPRESEDLDVWFGPRLFRNDPDILKLFTHQWERDYMIPISDNDPKKEEKRKEMKEMDPELWAGATFLPLVALLYRDKLKNTKPRVVSVDVVYINPEEQANAEKDESVADKRKKQSINVLHATAALLQVFSYDTMREVRLYQSAK